MMAAALLLLVLLPQLEVRMREGLAALERGDLAEAQLKFEEATRSAPDNAGAWLLLAETRARQRRAQPALAAAERAEKLGSGDRDVLRGLAHFYTELQPDLSKAAQQLERLIALSPYDEQARFQLAQAYLLRQDFPSAIRVLQDARKTFDKSPQIELTLGVAYYGSRNFTGAVDQFLKTIRLSPDVPQPYIFLGRILEHAGDRLPEAVERFASFRVRNPNNPLGYVLHAKAVIAQLPPGGYPPEAAAALDDLNKAVTLAGNSAEAHYLLGVLLDRKGDYAKAAVHLERSIALNAKDPAPHYRLARVYARLGRTQDAAEQRKIHEQLSEEEGAGRKP
jgi:tetratricopeptide (TPR) repeat protein